MAEEYTGEAYCVKCKEKRNFTGHVEEKNSRRFAKGICPECGTKVTRILGKALVADCDLRSESSVATRSSVRPGPLATCQRCPGLTRAVTVGL